MNQLQKVMLIGMLENYLKENKCTGVYFSIDKEGKLITKNFTKQPTEKSNEKPS